MSKANLIAPYGGELVNLVVEGKEREELLARSSKLPSIKITMRNLCDLELIATGGFSPLTSFMGKADYDRVLKEMRLADGTLFPLPITLTGLIQKNCRPLAKSLFCVIRIMTPLPS